MDEDDYTRITLRIPKELHQKLTESAKTTSKSMNAEIIGRLQQTFEAAGQTTTTTTYAVDDPLAIVKKLDAIIEALKKQDGKT